jgi:hypothetical protein
LVQGGYHWPHFVDKLMRFWTTLRGGGWETVWCTRRVLLDSKLTVWWEKQSHVTSALCPQPSEFFWVSSSLGRPKCAIRDPMSQHFNKFMRLNADNSFTLRVFLNCVVLCNMLIIFWLFVSKKITKICARVTRDPVSGFRVGIEFRWQKRSWNILWGVWWIIA